VARAVQAAAERIAERSDSRARQPSFFLHTDGQVAESSGLHRGRVRILNPIQPEVLDPAAIKRQYGKELIFLAPSASSNTLPFGTPDDVAAEVKLRMGKRSGGGRY